MFIYKEQNASRRSALLLIVRGPRRLVLVVRCPRRLLPVVLARPAPKHRLAERTGHGGRPQRASHSASHRSGARAAADHALQRAAPLGISAATRNDSACFVTSAGRLAISVLGRLCTTSEAQLGHRARSNQPLCGAAAAPAVGQASGFRAAATRRQTVPERCGMGGMCRGLPLDSRH